MIVPDFTPNNIEFQMLTAGAWGHFYKMREFLLSQLMISENRFHPTCKETLLLNFNVTRYWLLALEEDIKQVKCRTLEADEAVEQNVDNLNKCFDSMNETIRANPESFDPGYAAIFIEVFEKYRKFLVSKIRRTLKADIEASFHEIATFVARSMSHFLHILYELDYLYFSKLNNVSKDNFYPFVGLDFIDVNLYKERKVSLVEQRLDVYRKHELIKTAAYWTVKSYCSSEFLDSSYDTYTVFDKLLSDIESQGIRIACIM